MKDKLDLLDKEKEDMKTSTEHTEETLANEATENPQEPVSEVSKEENGETLLNATAENGQETQSVETKKDEQPVSPTEKKKVAPKQKKDFLSRIPPEKRKYLWIGVAVFALAVIGAIIAIVVTSVGGKVGPGNKTEYQVVFQTDGGSAISPYTLKEGDTIARPEDPTKTLFYFDNWYADAAHTVLFDFTQPMPAHDVTVYAGWIPEQSVLVVFDANGGTFANGATAYNKVMVVGSTLSIPNEQPSYRGYLFGNWYLDAAATTRYTFGQGVTENMTLYAGWEDDPDFAYISYYGNGAFLYRTPIEKGSVLSEAAFDAEGLIVDGWYSDAAKTQKYHFGNAVNENLTLYASYYTAGLRIESGVVTGYLGWDSDIIVPDSYEGTPVTEIGAYAFDSSSKFFKLHSVTLPATVTKIGEGAFYNCEELVRVNLSDKVTEIGAFAFFNNMRLQSFGDISGVTDIAEGTFLGCENLLSITLSPNTRTVGAQAFADCKSLTSMVLPQQVTTISDGLFTGCAKLTEVEFKAGGMAQLTFGKEVFVGTALQRVIIRTKTRAVFSAVSGSYPYSPFVKCENVTVYVDPVVVSAYVNYYGYLDDNTFGDKIAAIG